MERIVSARNLTPGDQIALSDDEVDLDLDLPLSEQTGWSVHVVTAVSVGDPTIVTLGGTYDWWTESEVFVVG